MGFVSNICFIVFCVLGVYFVSERKFLYCDIFSKNGGKENRIDKVFRVMFYNCLRC